MKHFEMHDPNELEPWLILLGEGTEGSLALWRLSSNDALTVALFSSRDRALEYANQFCGNQNQIVQVERTRFLALMVDCFRQGIRYATLNPGDRSAQSVFVLRDVLVAARQTLSGSDT
jgi:hypothetical protein